MVIPFKKDDFTNVISKLAEENSFTGCCCEQPLSYGSKHLSIGGINDRFKICDEYVCLELNITAYADQLLGSMPLEFVTGALGYNFLKYGIRVLTNGVNVVEKSHGINIEYILTRERTVKGSKIVQRVLVFESNQKLVLLNRLHHIAAISKDAFAERTRHRQLDCTLRTSGLSNK